MTQFEKISENAYYDRNSYKMKTKKKYPLKMNGFKYFNYVCRIKLILLEKRIATLCLTKINGGGGGDRTRVQRTDYERIYMHSRL